MEKVIDLFKAFRNKEIDYETLFGELTKMLSEDPHFSVQAISTLDNAQQLTPIPVTDFINLRAKLESTAETFHRQETTPGPADAESTMLYQEESSEEATLASNTLAPSDPTLMGSNPATESRPPSHSTAPVKPAPPSEDDYADEATVIMPMPPRQSAPINQVPSTQPSPAASTTQPAEDDEHATLIATATSTAPAAEPTPAPTAMPIATPSVERKPSKTSPSTNEQKSTAPTKSSKPPFAIIGIGVAALLVIILLIVLWPSSEPTPEVAKDDAKTTSMNEESTAWGQKVPQDVPEPTQPEPMNTSPTLTSSMESPTIDDLAPETEMEESEFFSEDSELTDTVDITTTTEIEPTAEIKAITLNSESDYMAAITAAIDAENLGPASQEGSATFLLVGLIKFNKDSDQISEARTLISKKHLEMAKTARSNSQWDAAQQHLDDALKVRLPDSYLSE